MTIQQKINGLILYAVVLSLVQIYSFLQGKNTNSSNHHFEEITTQRINIVEGNGQTRMVLTNQAKCPLPVVGGKTYPRSIQPGGIIFYRDNGDETGGIAVNKGTEHESTHLILDYKRSEAIGFGVTETVEGEVYAGMSILDKTPDGPILEVGTTGKERINVEVLNKTATISLHDPEGFPRILLEVDSLGEASLKFLAKNGALVYSLPK